MSTRQDPLRLALVGFGAIGQALAAQLRGIHRICLSQIIVPTRSLAATQATCAALAPQATVLDALDPNRRPDLLAECAGHAAVEQHMLPALRSGIPCVIASIGALHDAALLARLETAALDGCTQVKLICGAIAGIDALAAARLGGLDDVHYIGRKPPMGWLGTPAEQICDLAALQQAQVIFRGSARQAAQQYPKNANVAATVSLAGLGLDRTQVELIADPSVTRNVHQIVARGTFGQLELKIENLPLKANPKTSAQTVYSLAHTILNMVDPVIF
jgi:aspartate dehydrogenase